MTTYFDVETSSAPDSVLERVKPEFKAPANYKDPDKIAAAKADAETAWRGRAALDAKTANILAIGILDDTARILTGLEPEILNEFWKTWSADGGRFVGFCVKSFDLPMLVQRSWICGVLLPVDLMEGRYWNRRIVDLQEIWTCFGRQTEGQSLDAICKANGLDGKLPGMSGGDFARVFAENRPKALAYLNADLLATAALAHRLGIV